MTIFLTQSAYWALLAETNPCLQKTNGYERVVHYPKQLGWGYERWHTLRPGLTLDIADYTLRDAVVTTSSEYEHPLEYTFCLPPGHTHTEAERYGLWGSGLSPDKNCHKPANQRIAWMSVHLDPAVFCDWLQLSDDELPAPWRELVRPADQHYYERFGTPLASMQMVLQQIWHCPYQGLTRRLYLESKVWELMSLVLNEFDSNAATAVTSQTLRPDDIERIHQASEILQTRLDQPPSLIELAHLIGINDHKLKLGFREVFGTTVFGYLHEVRLERSRQLLETGTVNVTEAARAVGYVNRSYFASAFRRRFGMNPSAYSRWQISKNSSQRSSNSG